MSWKPSCAIRLAALAPFATTIAYAQPESLPPLPPPTPPAASVTPSAAPASPSPTPTGPDSPASPTAATSAPAAASPEHEPQPEAHPVQPGAYLHDGFYLRAGLGFSYGWLSGTGPAGPAHLSGSGAALSFAVGGTPVRGLVFAFTIQIASADGAMAGAPPGATGPASTVEPVVGLLVDWYPDPKDGWHLGGSTGLGGVGLTDGAGVNSNGYSFGISAQGGYDWWIGQQWSLGLMMFAAVAAASSTEDSNGVSAGYRLTPATTGLEGSIVFH